VKPSPDGGVRILAVSPVYGETVSSCRFEYSRWVTGILLPIDGAYGPFVKWPR
jgi:hypothetical protein